MPVVGVRNAAIIAVLVFLFLLCSMSGIVFASSVMWSQTYRSAAKEVAHCLVETSEGGYAIAGDTSSFGAGGIDFCLVKTNEYGNIPELPSWTSLRVLMVAVVAVILVHKINLRKHNRGDFDVTESLSEAS